MAEQPAGKMERAEIEGLATIYWDNTDNLVYDSYGELDEQQMAANFALSILPKLRREAMVQDTKRVCGLCRSGKSEVYMHKKYGYSHRLPHGPLGDFICGAGPILAAIALLDLEIAKGAAK